MKYIVEFQDFEQRDKWVAQHGDVAHTVYSKNPWVAADLSQSQVCELEQKPGVKLYPDVQMKPV